MSRYQQPNEQKRQFEFNSSFGSVCRQSFWNENFRKQLQRLILISGEFYHHRDFYDFILDLRELMLLFEALCLLGSIVFRSLGRLGEYMNFGCDLKNHGNNSYPPPSKKNLFIVRVF